MKKVFNVHFSTSQPDKTDVVYYVAETFSEVLCAIPVEDASRVVGVTIGPEVKVL